MFNALDAKCESVLDDDRVIDNISADDIEMVEKLDRVTFKEVHVEEHILEEELLGEGDMDDLKNLEEHTKE